MPIALRRYFGFGQTQAGAENNLVTRLAMTLACGAVIVAGVYFALLYLLTNR
jgi:hypothetical protein